MRHPQVAWIEFERVPAGIRIHCTACGAGAGPLAPAQADEFVRAHAEHRSAARGHYGAGDAIAAATKAVGITPCSPCEARRRRLNQLFPRVWPR